MRLTIKDQKYITIYSQNYTNEQLDIATFTGAATFFL